MKKSFTAFEYHEDACFYPANYCYEGSKESGWNIYRNNEPHLTLPPGYLLLKTLCCGICSTDIARHNLPFPLPQITGHEVVALHNNKMVVIDINASHKHLGDLGNYCAYCDNGLENHCPDRLTLGIDRLPGGFAPYILVPEHAIVPLPDDFDIKLASIIEPFAAALHAVETENIQNGDEVAIVGPRRLGSLLILALKLWRAKNNINFKITALTRNKEVRSKDVRRDNLRGLCELAGADEVIDINKSETSTYDVVFDTSGSISGFELALLVAKRVVHVKSTSGQEVFGLKYLTEMVIDELSLLPLSDIDLSQNFINVIDQKIKSPRIMIDSSMGESIINGFKKQYSDLIVTDQYVLENSSENLVRSFDIAIGASFEFINTVIRNKTGRSAIKPKGILFLKTDSENSPISLALKKGLRINTSRCGYFSSAISLLHSDLSFSRKFLEYFISDTYAASHLLEAFKRAKNDKEAIKILVEHKEAID